MHVSLVAYNLEPFKQVSLQDAKTKLFGLAIAIFRWYSEVCFQIKSFVSSKIFGCKVVQLESLPTLKEKLLDTLRTKGMPTFRTAMEVLSKISTPIFVLNTGLKLSFAGYNWIRNIHLPKAMPQLEKINNWAPLFIMSTLIAMHGLNRCSPYKLQENGPIKKVFEQYALTRAFSPIGIILGLQLEKSRTRCANLALQNAQFILNAGFFAYRTHYPLLGAFITGLGLGLCDVKNANLTLDEPSLSLSKRSIQKIPYSQLSFSRKIARIMKEHGFSILFAGFSLAAWIKTEDSRFKILGTGSQVIFGIREFLLRRDQATLLDQLNMDALTLSSLLFLNQCLEQSFYAYTAFLGIIQSQTFSALKPTRFKLIT